MIAAMALLAGVFLSLGCGHMLLVWGCYHGLVATDAGRTQPLHNTLHPAPCYHLLVQ